MARYPAKLNFALRVPLLLIRASQKRCFAEVTDDEVHLQFGSWGRHIPLEEIAAVRRSEWKTIYGFGHRPGGKYTLGLMGSGRNVVEVELKAVTAMKVWPITMQIKFLKMALDDPDAFIAEVTPRLTTA